MTAPLRASEPTTVRVALDTRAYDIVIIGSGFAARQLVKNIRKQDTQIPLLV